jgi:hypothetical protein
MKYLLACGIAFIAGLEPIKSPHWWGYGATTMCGVCSIYWAVRAAIQDEARK